MCGIFGFSAKKGSKLQLSQFEEISKFLFKQTETRGKDASGLALHKNDKIVVLKDELSAKNILKTKAYSSLIKNYLIGLNKPSSFLSDPITVIGHSRMVTNGSQDNHFDNQPVIKDEKVTIHNGIIVNEKEIWSKYPIKKQYEVDTEVIPSLISHYQDDHTSLISSICKTYKTISGVASIAIMFQENNSLLLATNNGSLYCAFSDNIFLFASEQYMLQQTIQQFSQLNNLQISHIKAGEAIILDLETVEPTIFSLNEDPLIKKEFKKVNAEIIDVSTNKVINKLKSPNQFAKNNDLLIYNKDKISQLRRCTVCLLPETFPFIQYDEKGVCSMCKTHKKIVQKGKDELNKALLKYNANNGEPNVVVPLSGGRDSCYTLHYIKKELGLNPIAFTYDWGMVTDLARRNISRMCSKLGIEHILISADIRQKRENIQKNVSAWLKKPHLGTIPLFMAGDKQYFYYLNQVLKQNNVKLAIYGENPYEKTNFKTGFCGINEGSSRVYYDISLAKKIKLGLFYSKEFITNPLYINSSLLDTFGAFLSAYFLNHDDYLFLYQYIPWEEEKINQVLIGEYDWELSPDTSTTWRIGDGTASFYNYIYNTVAGFTENDTLRSNQIREGLLNREKALELIYVENRPRRESIKWYLETIGLDFEQTIKRINQIPTLY